MDVFVERESLDGKKEKDKRYTHMAIYTGHTYVRPIHTHSEDRRERSLHKRGYPHIHMYTHSFEVTRVTHKKLLRKKK